MEEDDELGRAIAMLLEQPESSPADCSTRPPTHDYTGPRIDGLLEFNQKYAKAGRDFGPFLECKSLRCKPKTTHGR